jgi:hypothetical protein
LNPLGICRRLFLSSALVRYLCGIAGIFDGPKLWGSRVIVSTPLAGSNCSVRLVITHFGVRDCKNGGLTGFESDASIESMWSSIFQSIILHEKTIPCWLRRRKKNLEQLFVSVAHGIPLDRGNQPHPEAWAPTN